MSCWAEARITARRSTAAVSGGLWSRVETAAGSSSVQPILTAFITRPRSRASVPRIFSDVPMMEGQPGLQRLTEWRVTRNTFMRHSQSIRVMAIESYMAPHTFGRAQMEATLGVLSAQFPGVRLRRSGCRRRTSIQSTCPPALYSSPSIMARPGIGATFLVSCRLQRSRLTRLIRS